MIQDEKDESRRAGGLARASVLTPKRRSEIAKKAAGARWEHRAKGGAIPTVKCGSPDQPLRIGDIEIPCYVLEDGRRVLSQRGLQAGMGLSRSAAKSGARRLAHFLGSLEKKGLDLKGLTARADNPFNFLPPHGGTAALAYEATILPEICEAVLLARREAKLLKQQEHIAVQCEILLGGLARVGIIALVDEVTGYQDQRAHDALTNILEEFIADGLRPYVRTFPLDFYKQIYHLRGWAYPPRHNRHNSILGKLTNDLVYDRLAPGVRDALHRATPRLPSGRLKYKLFQRLTDDIGHPRLREHLGALVMALKMSDDWRSFMQTVNRLLPKYPRLEDKSGQRNLQFQPTRPD